MRLLAQLRNRPKQFIKKLLTESGIYALRAEFVPILVGIGLQRCLFRQCVRAHGRLGDCQCL